MNNIRSSTIYKGFETQSYTNINATKDPNNSNISIVQNFPWLLIPLPPKIIEKSQKTISKRERCFPTQILTKIAVRVGKIFKRIFPISCFFDRIIKARKANEERKHKEVKKRIALVNYNLNANYFSVVDSFKVIHANPYSSIDEKKKHYSSFLKSYFSHNAHEILFND